MKGYRDHLAKAKSPKAVPRKASAAGRGMISAMLATLDWATPIGQRDAAIILGGFSIGGRRGEIASLDIGDITFHAKGMQVQVYRQKSRVMDDPVVMYRPDPVLCPVRAIETWTATLAAKGRITGPLFVRVNQHGHIAHPVMRDGQPIGDPDGRMIGQAIADVIRRAALAAGLGGRWSGHSLRRGLATEMRLVGMDRRLIERQGGWTAGSTAVSGYIDDADRWLWDVLEGVL
jgi:integrase